MLSNDNVSSDAKRLYQLPLWLRRLFAVCVLSIYLQHPAPSPGQTPAPAATNPPPAAEPATPQRFSPAVEQKALIILEEAGLRVTRRAIHSGNTASINKAMSSLAREKRKLRMLKESLNESEQQLYTINNQLRQGSNVRAQLSLQLANVRPGDATTNNRLVGLLEANKVMIENGRRQRDQATELVNAALGKLNDAEAEYTGKVLQLRKDYEQSQLALEQTLSQQEVQTALRVLRVNRDLPIPTADSLLSTVDRRLSKVEQEVHQEAIPLTKRGNSLLANVVINSKTVSMVVDTGASLICLPAAVATEIGVTVDETAEPIRLQLADGRIIDGHKVLLPRVRVGDFEVLNVEAAVLGKEAVAAEPLLGMSYLGNFRPEIDPAAGTMRMTRVD